METQIKILQVLIPIFIGIFFRYCRIFGDKEGETLRYLVVRLCMPILIFFSMYEAGGKAISSIPATIGAFVLVTAGLFCVGFAASAFVKSGAKKSAIHAAVTFGNYAWMGYGVCQILLGDTGLRRAVFFTLLWWPAFYGFGLPIGFIHNRKEKTRIPLGRVFKIASPVFLAMIFGLGFNLLEVKIPSFLYESIKPFGNMTVPLILFSVGVTLNFAGIRKAFKPALLISGMTLIIGPVLGFLIANLLSTQGVTYKSIILESAMPVATLTPIFAEHFDIDLDIVNTSIVLSTILSMITLPIVATLVV